jgi:F420H(2)-dependent quinone reductase
VTAGEPVALSTWDWVREQTEQAVEAGTTDGILVEGKPIVLLTLRGAKSGKLRYTPLMRVEHEGTYAVVASKGGTPENPTWYHNITANPVFPMQDGTVTRTYRAREVHGEERAVWWERAVAAYPSYADYQARTTRTIPVFVLDPS